MPDMSATSRACASTSPTSSAFCSPVEALAAGGVLRPVPDDEIADMRADQRPPRGGVAAAIVAQDGAIAVLGFQRRPVDQERLHLALKREPRQGKGRGIVALGLDQRLEPAHAFEPRRGDRDAELGRLALDRVEPGGV